MGFVISYFEAKLYSDGQEPKSLEFAYVISDEFDAPDNPQQSLNAKSKTGFGAFTRMNYPKSAAFVLKEPVSILSGSKLRFRLVRMCSIWILSL